MWKKLKNLLPKIVLCLLLAFCCLSSSVGYTQTATEMTESITIPIAQWQNLKNELNLLNSDLLQCKSDLTKLKKPSTELLSELAEAQDMLLKLTRELDEQKQDLTVLSNEVSELRELSATLKTQIDKERRVHKRQIWQNRIWCILIGAGIGFACGR